MLVEGSDETKQESVSESVSLESLASVPIYVKQNETLYMAKA